MADSNFVDYVKIYCRSGKGGRGSMHLRHVKYQPNGGPDGGDGGHGGSVYLRGNHNYWTLLHLKYRRHVYAEHGGNGGRDKCHGTDGKDVYIDVPCGTVVYNAETGKYICDVTYDGQTVLLLKGGLGIVSYRDGLSFVMADIPGIIEGASAGKGLGLRFLRHIERNSLLLFMVPGDTDDIKREYEILLNELKKFNPEMLDKHRVLAITKCDLLDEELEDMLKSTLPTDVPVVFISAVTGKGLGDLKDILWTELNSESNKLQEITAEDTLIHRDKDMSNFAKELQDEGEDGIEYIDEEEIEDVEDLEDFEYE